MYLITTNKIFLKKKSKKVKFALKMGKDDRESCNLLPYLYFDTDTQKSSFLFIYYYLYLSLKKIINVFHSFLKKLFYWLE